MFDLNLLMKRGKIAGKTAIQNLTFQDHNNKQGPITHRPKSTTIPAIEHDNVIMINAAVFKALEMLQSEIASPALPGFGRTPTVRQLRITDSPLPLRDRSDHAGDMMSHVNEKADEFIS
ncbi:putative ethylene-responsive transcription factor TINY-like [Capsicum annuum]|nr:putative ethylene-responsive transcription factor TINY-like [Capsicum annuum]